MNSILLGDHDWSPSLAAQEGTSLPQLILNQENLLSNAYKRELAQGAKLLRTPTRETCRGFLAQENLAERVEAVHNIAVQAGRDCITKTGADALLCAVIGPCPIPDPAHAETTLIQQVSEPAIYMIDKGVDCLQIEGIADPEHLKWAMQTVKRVNHPNIPLSLIFPLSAAHGPEIMPRIVNLGHLLEFAMVGFELSLEEAAQLGEPKGMDSMALAFQIRAPQGAAFSEDLARRALERIKVWAPTMLSGGVGLGAKEWNRIKELAQEVLLTP